MHQTSAAGTNRTTSDVRSSVANGDKPDMARTAQFGRDWPWTDIGPSRTPSV